MTMLAIGSAVAGGLSSIFGGQAQGAAIRAQNEQAYRNWIQANSQKTFNNAREQFQVAQAFSQQLKRNSAIARSAYETQSLATQALQNTVSFQQNELSKQVRTQQGTLVNALLAKGISGSSGLMQSLALNQTLNALAAAKNLEYNASLEKQNIDRQTKNALSQQTDNVFMPNLQLYDQAPIFGDPNAAEMGGLISGIVQIGGAVAAAGIETPKTTTTTTTPRTVSATPTTSTSSRITQPTSRASFITRR
jgi:hypothetical protein